MARGGKRPGAGGPKIGEGWRERQREKRLMSKKDPAPKKCAHCGEIFINERYKYCSSECCLAANHKKQTSFSHICPKCGKNFEGQGKQKHCSRDCSRRQNQRISADGTPEKRCPACGEWKQATEEHYYHNKQGFDGLTVYCKQCSNKAAIAHSKTTYGKRLRKESNIRNIETIRAYRKKVRPITNERAKIRARTDPAFQLNRRMRCLMWNGLKKNKGGRKWQDLVGYSVDDLRRHIERRFKNGMNWDRFLAGEIHIDHKIPRSVFNYSHPEHLDFKRCWALRNLQPMWAKDNISKGARLDKPFQPSLAIGGHHGQRRIQAE